MIVRRFPYMGYEMAMRAGYQHQRAIEFVVVGQQHRAAQRAHGRHSVFAVPGLEIGVPVEFLALESGLVVDARLVDVDFAAEDFARNVQHARIAHQVGKQAVQAMHIENRAHFAAVRFRDGFFATVVRILVAHRLHRVGSRVQQPCHGRSSLPGPSALLSRPDEESPDVPRGAVARSACARIKVPFSVRSPFLNSPSQ